MFRLFKISWVGYWSEALSVVTSNDFNRAHRRQMLALLKSGERAVFRAPLNPIYLTFDTSTDLPLETTVISQPPIQFLSNLTR